MAANKTRVKRWTITRRKRIRDHGRMEVKENEQQGGDRGSMEGSPRTEKKEREKRTPIRNNYKEGRKKG